MPPHNAKYATKPMDTSANFGDNSCPAITIAGTAITDPTTIPLIMYERADCNPSRDCLAWIRPNIIAAAGPARKNPNITIVVSDFSDPSPRTIGIPIINGAKSAAQNIAMTFLTVKSPA
jgi:hypothetical protein